jgi:hypothetical protein
VITVDRQGQLTAARAVELLHGTAGEDELPDFDGTALGERRGELGMVLRTARNHLYAPYVSALSMFLR